MDLISPSDEFSDVSAASIHYTEVLEEEMTKFKSSNDKNEKVEHFTQIMGSFNYLLNHLKPSYFKKETTIDLYYFIFDNIDTSLSTIGSSMEAAKAIAKINTLFSLNGTANPFLNSNPNSKLNPNAIKEILLCCCKNFDECPEISTAFLPFLSALFSKEDYFPKLAKSNIYEYILSNILLVIPTQNYDKFLFDLCFVSAKPNYFTYIPLNSFFSCFTNSVQKDLIPDFAREITAKFVATLVSKVANVSKGTIDLFNKSGCFSAYDTLISKFPEPVRPSYYSFFFVSQCEPPLIDHLLTIYQNNPKYEQSYFDMVHLRLRTQPELLNKCKIPEWFEMAQPKLKKLTAFFKFIADQDLKLAASCLTSLLNSINKITIKYKKANQIMNTISIMLSSRFVSVEELSRMHFLDVFFFHTTPNCFLELIYNPSYLNIFISVYLVLPSDCQNQYFMKICEYINEINRDKFILICTTLISKSPTIDCMKTLFTLLDAHKDCYYIKILLNSFLDIETDTDIDSISEMCLDSTCSVRSTSEMASDISEDYNFDFLKCQRNFIIAGGIDWIFSSNILDINSVVDLIAHLVSSRSYEQLELKINNLDKSHPIFSVDQQLMRKMVYGLVPSIKYSNIDLYFRPIRIRSLFHYITENITQLNPYNIFFLGKQFVDLKLRQFNQGSSIYDIPYISSFGNRCISPEHIPLLFSNPRRLHTFCDDDNFDHFPFYILFCDKYPLTFIISSKYSAVSFWFKIEQKANSNQFTTVMFQSDNGIKIHLLENLIRVSIETTKFNYELIDEPITQTNWNHVFIRISSSIGIGSNVFISINLHLLPIKTRKKLNPITNICFTNHNPSSILYLSNSVRLFSNPQKNSRLIEEIYAKGPSFLGLYEQSFIIRPTIRMANKKKTNDKKKFIKSSNNIGIPSNIYLVPYLGFSKHPLSHKLIVQMIKTCKDESLFDNLLDTFIKMLHLNSKLLMYYELIDIIKNSEIKVSYKMFIRLLTEQIKKFDPTKDLLKELIFDSKLAEIYDASFLLKALFELFPIEIWNKERIFMMYIVHVILTNSDDPKIADLIMLHLLRFPTLMKYISSIIKVAPILSHLNPVWSQVEFRENSQIQDILVKYMTNSVSSENYVYYKSFLPFTEIKSLFLVSSDHLCSLLFEMISKFNMVSSTLNFPPYYEIDFVFVSKLVQLSHIEQVWDCAMRMHNLPSLLALLWSSSISYSYFYSNPESYDKKLLEAIENKIDKAVSICIDSIQTIFNSPICMKMFLSLFPYIFTYSSLFNTFNRMNDNIQFEPITLSNYQFADINDDLWIGKQYILSRFNFPSSPPPLSYFSFLNQVISSVLRNYGFPLPFSFKIQSIDDVTDWFARSPLLDLVISIISTCSISHLDSFLYSIVSCEDHNNPLLPTLVHALLTRIPTNSIERITVILDYISILSAFQLFNQNALILISDLFMVMQIIQSKFNEKEATIVSRRIQPVMMSLFHSIPNSEIKMLFSLLINHMKTFAFLVSSSDSLHAWLYSFIAFSHNEIEIFNDFMNKFKSLIILNEEDSLILEKISKRQIQNCVDILQTIETEWKDQSNDFHNFASLQYHKFNDEEVRMIKEINQLSIDFNYFKYYSNVKHLLLSFFVSQNIRYFEIASSLYEEQICWIILLRNIKKQFLAFQPKKRFISNCAWPFHDTKIDLQSVFQEIRVEKNKAQTIKSDSIKTFKKTIKYQYVYINDIPLNLYELFKDLKGTPESMSNITMKLGKYEIPCVLFIFDKKIIIITYMKLKALPAKLTTPNSAMSISTSALALSSNDYDFISIKEGDSFQRDYFLQNCFCGNFGRIELFGSQICININRDSIIYIQYLDKLRIKMWTLFNGHYDLILSQKTNIKLMDPFPFNPVPSKEELYQQWSSSQISTNDLFEKLSQMSQIQVNSELSLRDKFIQFYGESFVQKNNPTLNENEIKYYAPHSANLDELSNATLPISFLIKNSISYLSQLYSPFSSSIFFKGPNNVIITTSKVCCSCIYFVVEIDVLDCRLTIKCHETIADNNDKKGKNKNTLKKYDDRFQSATHVSVSVNGVFVAVDYSFGYTEIFRIISEKKSSTMQNSPYFLSVIPKSIEKVVEFNIETLYDDIYILLKDQSVHDMVPPNKSINENGNKSINESQKDSDQNQQNESNLIAQLNNDVNQNQSNENINPNQPNLNSNEDTQHEAAALNASQPNINPNQQIAIESNSSPQNTIELNSNQPNDNSIELNGTNHKNDNVHVSLDDSDSDTESNGPFKKTGKPIEGEDLLSVKFNQNPKETTETSDLNVINNGWINKNVKSIESNDQNSFFPNYSLISGHDLICISFFGNRIVMLSLVTGFAINKVELPSQITAVAIDEYNSSIIVAMEKNGIQVIDFSTLSKIEGELEMPISFSLFDKDKITALSVVQNENTDQLRTVICGTDSGRLFLLYFDQHGVDIRPLNSKHIARITKLELDPAKRGFVSIDADGIVYLWSRSKNDQFNIEIDG